MKLLRFFVPLILSIVLILVLNSSIGVAPPLGKFLSPFVGFWQNARTGRETPYFNSNLKGLIGKVVVYTDEHQVPHIQANNDHDLYFMQGYVTARDRLWQMEFITFAASGRVSELIGEKGLEFDRTQRRLGLPYAAKQAMHFIDKDTAAKIALQAYADGVNSYISGLKPKELPLEYKLLNYQPEQWTPYKTAMLLKFMAKLLTDRENDLQMTATLNKFGREIFDLLYPDNYPDGNNLEPIVPIGTRFDFSKVKIDTPKYTIPKGLFADALSGDNDFNIGSNNWAVSGKKTVTGSPILCSDPHLPLNLPSIWYEMQLTSPSVNVYGATLPGAPCVIIGFNNKVAWGVTNASRDVKDWYTIQFTDKTKDTYMFDGKPRKTEKIVEAIKIKGRSIFYDTVVYTHIGPVSYDENFKLKGTGTPIALRWTALDPSDEMKTFLLLNRANSYNDYVEALNYYQCPGQNFVFASVDGDIAIKQQGKFVAKWNEQGKFIMDGTTSAQQWQAFIPNEQNPTVLNPERGFVSSANQHPTDSLYPYYYNGGFEHNRNRRINHELKDNNHITPNDMMRLQNDNMNLSAQNLVPVFIKALEKLRLSDNEQRGLDTLRKWDYFNEPNYTAPSIFHLMNDTLYHLLWLYEKYNGLMVPNRFITEIIIVSSFNGDTKYAKIIDKENINQLIISAYKKAMAKIGSNFVAWADCKATTINHWAKVPALGSDVVKNGGGKHIVNATDDKDGPSWRMVVSLEKEGIKAWATYPGGQSGNPGSPFYDNRIDEWAKGKYHELHFLSFGLNTNQSYLMETFNPAQ